MTWLPPCIPVQLVPALRRLGARGVEYHEVLDPQSPHYPGYVCFANLDGLSLGERQLLDRVQLSVLLTVGNILAEGPKLFVIPPDMIDDLNQVDIPLKVSDYCQPFPAVIVKSGDEYHFCEVVGGRPFIMTVNNGVSDSCGMCQLDRTIESYLSDSDLWLHSNEWMARLPGAGTDFIHPHRFRATLNFLLMLMAGGFTEVTERKRTKKQRRGTPAKHLVPKKYRPQNIKLWQKRLIDATCPEGGHGSKKCPHWRRAHWRRVAVGKGRIGRELRLIPAVLVNKEHLTTDVADTEYTSKA